MAKFM